MIDIFYTLVCALFFTIIIAFGYFCVSMPNLQKQAITQNKTLDLKFAVADVVWFVIVALAFLSLAIWVLSDVTTLSFFNLPMLILSVVFLSALYRIKGA